MKSQLKEEKGDLVIFNNELSPSQIRNLEEEWETKVLDRTSLILEIFAKRAKTREAKLQVEVARLQYALPKLIGSNETLVQIGASEIPTILVFNKADLISQDLPSVEGDKVTLSAKKKIGIEELIYVVQKKVFNQTIKCKFLVPYEQGKIVSYLNENVNTESVAYETNGTLLTVECREQDFHRFKKYIWEEELS